MLKSTKHIYNSIATICLVAMFFSCTNSKKEVRDFLADKNLPVGSAVNIYHVHKDSGRITSKTKAPVFYDYSNKKHSYKEFPKGIEIVTINKSGIDSTTISGNYALAYDDTKVSEIRGNVVIINHSKQTKLETNQLFWDQKEHYFFTEDGFRFTTPESVINGFGFESSEDLTKWIAKDITGDIETTQKDI
ncbi:LPS export ABC transporter protein LptC [Tenacibaculum sediminilitoris]|uniref:LPS export ABC transporter periplasmic protein LptC n=1 Tax=Tenacibaculum sediminilitoris TaxID=1820334 RepID=UPI0038942D09